MGWLDGDPYSISQFFDFLTGELLIDESHCECPAGRYRCSHILAETCMIYIAQLKSDWSLEDIVQFLPEAIKSLQALPISISYIYKILEPNERKLTAALKRAGTALAREHPGYAAEEDDDDESDEEVERQAREEVDNPDDGNFDVCAKVRLIIQESEARAESSGSEHRASPKYSSSHIRAYNSDRVHSVLSGPRKIE